MSFAELATNQFSSPPDAPAASSSISAGGDAPVSGPLVREPPTKYAVRAYAPGLATGAHNAVNVDAGAELRAPAIATSGLSEQSRKILGTLAFSRINDFRNYRPNWNGRGAKAVDAGSLSSLDLFVRTQCQFATIPSAFLNESGHLILEWENRNGSSVEAEFLPGAKCLVYFGDEDEKINVPISPYSLALLAQRLS